MRRPAELGRVTKASAALVAALACVACEPSPRQRFARDVAPVLEMRCSANVCHGAPVDAPAADVVDHSRFFLPTDAQGRLVDVDAAYRITKRVIDPTDPPFSNLLRKPLPIAFGGLAHAGGASFSSTRDEAYAGIRAWIESEDRGGETAAPLSHREQQFADTVEPVLASVGCMAAGCHGTSSAIPFRLDAGIGGRRSIGAQRANYDVSIRMLALDGDPTQSRLLRKMLPLHDGGIVHKGGNTGFLRGRDDARAQPILDWACAEREARTGAPCASESTPLWRGLVYVRGPITAEDPFDLDVFVPGSDVFFAPVTDDVLDTARAINLSAALHDAPADVRDPAVSADGRRVALSMRRSAEEGHAIYEIDLATLAVTPRTPHGGALPGGGILTDRDPTYGPDGHLWFVSTRAGVVADRSARLDGDLYELDPSTGDVTRRTATPHIERKPVFYVTGEEAGGEISFTALRDVFPEVRRAHPFRFPPSLATEYHQHFGVTPDENLLFDMRELPDGRYACVIGDLANAWSAGRLGVVDRNFGPEIPLSRAHERTSLPLYAAPLARLDEAATSVGVTARMVRDPVALPDGRLLVASAEGPFDLADPNAAPRFTIEVITLGEDLHGAGPHIAAQHTLVQDDALSVTDPEPVFVRMPAPQDAESSWTPGESTGVLLHQGLPLIDAILGNLPPSGEKSGRADITGVRLVEDIPVAPALRVQVPADETRHGVEGATVFALSGRNPTRILAELPIAEDGTFQVEAPILTPFRLQALDDEAHAVGTQHNRWFYVSPGQRVPQGASTSQPDVYSTSCAACHGSLDGDPAHAFVVPDVLTMASVTLARYADGNPRRPLPPWPVGDHTRVSVDYLHDIAPLLLERCVSCHAGPDPAAGLALDATPTAHYQVGYEELLRPGEGSGSGRAYVDDVVGSAVKSYLLELLSGREHEAPRVHTSAIAHPKELGASALDDDELLTLVRWIDLGAPYTTPDDAVAP
jgi:Hydrazine synthase alpha subunit middle domain